ncbi:pyridoxamine 5'-phosphate oxidase family protein [Natrinema sp. SYSU A 869]|uniref:pyridoxamine 5'-phosphate oxidase family protein n=1 Tax=Natrinema sp. SYSU A 869 TaxID=2871694 RepID=UPI001CA45609|nr:pyridoxamine 5'-phosphate oxidase family protein [Natrinema sp. SYSU A 869]
MDRIELVYTFGMDDTELEDHLERTDTGALALAADSAAYAFPIAHYYEDETLYVRLSTDGSSTKCRASTILIPLNEEGIFSESRQ